jgi:hypothetical protein
MKANSLIALLLLFCITIGYSQRPSFLYKRKIANTSQEGWYNIALPVDLFSHLKNDFTDVRIYSIAANDTIEIPYLLKIREDQITEETVELSVFNKSKKNDVLYFSFDTKGNAVNYLNLNFAQQNFNAFVKIEGSNDQREWYELIKDQRILSIDNESVQYNSTQVNFPHSSYQYLRVSVKSDVPLTLINASFKNNSTKAGIVKTFTPAWIVKHDKKYKQTIIDITLNDVIPINQIEVDASSDLDYYRSFTLEYASDSSKTPKGWTVFYSVLDQGYLTSIDKNIFNFTLQPLKKLRLTINNQDNAPLTINHIKVSAPEVALLARLKPADTFLFYGNRSLESPSYDLIRFAEKIPDSLRNASLEKEEVIAEPIVPVNPLFSNKQWLWGIMIITIAVLGFFTLRMIKIR